MTASVTLTMPGGWRFIEAGTDRDQAIDDAVDAAYAKADRDSSAVAKHWLKNKLRQSFEVPEGSDSEVVAVAYPERPMGGVLLPASAAILKLSTSAQSQQEAMTKLALLAAQEQGASIIATDVGVVLRSYALRDAAEALAQQVAEAPIEAADRGAIAAAIDEVPTVRARYVVPSGDGEPWHAVVFSALIGDGGEELALHYVELFDAFIQTLSRKDR